MLQEDPKFLLPSAALQHASTKLVDFLVECLTTCARASARALCSIRQQHVKSTKCGPSDCCFPGLQPEHFVIYMHLFYEFKVLNRTIKVYRLLQSFVMCIIGTDLVVESDVLPHSKTQTVLDVIQVLEWLYSAVRVDTLLQDQLGGIVLLKILRVKFLGSASI